MQYADYRARFLAYASLGRIEEYGCVHEGGLPYALLKLTTPGPRTVVVTSGFHGEEQAGPLTLLEHLAELVAHARARGVGLRIYPCANPSGFEDGTRYNRSGERPNNDFLRYETATGLWQGELRDGETFLRWAVHGGGPRETRALAADLERFAVPEAALDLHQDRQLPGPLVYAYAFGDPEPYRALLAASSAYAAVARDTVVDEGQGLRTDADGLIAFHDGSVTDYFRRRGTRFAATLETTTDTPLPRCHRVNLAWLLGFVDLAAGA